MKKSLEERVNDFLASEDLIRFSLISVNGKNELVMENRKNGRMEIFDMFIYEMNLDGEKRKGVISEKRDCKFAVCFQQKGKVAFGLDDLKVFMGFPESCVKFMALAVKEEKSMIFLYDSHKMERVYIQGVNDSKKRQNLTEFYSVISKLGFSDGDTEPYFLKEEVDFVERDGIHD